MSPKLLPFLLLPSLPLVAAPTYSVQPLPRVDTSLFPLATYGSPNALNNQDIIAYRADYLSNPANPLSTTISRPYLYANGQSTLLHLPPSMDSASIGAPNDTGNTVGFAWNSAAPFTYLPARWSGQTSQLLPLGPYAQGIAAAINNANISAGYVVTSEQADGAHTNAVWWAPDATLHDLGSFSGTAAAALAVNNANQLLIAVSGPSTRNILLWQNGNTTTISSSTAGATALNDQGHVLYNAPDGPHGMPRFYLFDGASTHSLSPIPGNRSTNFYDLNNADQAVGSSDNDNPDLDIAVLWQNGTTYDLNTLLSPDSAHWRLTSAAAINDNGTILGAGYLDGVFTNFLLTPASNSLTPIPEPTSLALLAAASLPLLLKRRR